MDFSIFRKKTLRRIYVIKNCLIRINIHGEIKEKVLSRKFDHEGRENITIL